MNEEKVDGGRGKDCKTSKGRNLKKIIVKKKRKNMEIACVLTVCVLGLDTTQCRANFLVMDKYQMDYRLTTPLFIFFILSLQPPHSTVLPLGFQPILILTFSTT
jgi:hypothetical protein